MRKCIFCKSKTIAFYVSSDDNYMCPMHYEMAKKYFGKNAVRDFNKNKIIIKDKYAEMTIYNNSFVEKEVVLIDVEDIELVKDIRWHTSGAYSHVITHVNPQKLKISKKAELVISNALRLADYIMYLRFGITTPIYHTNENPLDCRKAFLRVARDKKQTKSTIKHILEKRFL